LQSQHSYKDLKNCLHSYASLYILAGNGSARKRVGDKVALQGNLDPAILLSTPEAIEKQVANVLASYGHGNGHVFNLGHGITQWTPPENAAAMLAAVREHSRQYHQ
jgi:uroporphyrinogen decarboxylase